MTSESCDLSELSERSDVPERTIRYWVHRKLVPPPIGRGRRSHYTEDHLERLRLIRRLQEGHMPLKEIESFIERLDERLAEPEGPSHLASIKAKFSKAADPASSSPEPPTDAEAAELGGELPVDGRSVADAALQYLARAAAAAAHAPSQLVAPFVSSRSSDADRPTPELGQRVKWERITIAEGVELCVSGPRSRKRDAAIEQLIETAKELFAEKSS